MMISGLVRTLMAGLIWLGTMIGVKAQEDSPSTNVRVPPGFEVNLIRAAGPDEDSWISMTFDDRGRLIVGLDSRGVARMTLDDTGGVTRFERIDDSFKHCRGVLYAHDSLYVSATNSQGFYRLQDSNGDDQFDRRTLLAKTDYRSRYGHGSNQIRLGPDGMVYLVVGNDVSTPDPVIANSPYRGALNDRLLRNPHDAGQDDRVGGIYRINPEGDRWELVAGGFRNQVDAAFNADGELFTYDADMEWDAGLPWYRPTRLNHVVSGGEYGWRWGTMKWPVFFEDSLPTTLDTGYGSPTGLEFGHASRFPERYQDVLFMADWQNGRIYAVDLIPAGASYEASYGIFLSGGPLNVCDMTFGPDGDLYFVTGGRGSKSGLYRVKWVGGVDEPVRPSAVDSIDQASRNESRRLRELRRSLERFHTRMSPQAVEQCWPHLGSPDRWLRSAARIALENQQESLWAERVLAEPEPLRRMTGSLALARVGSAMRQPEMRRAVIGEGLQELSLTSLMTGLRAIEVSLCRHPELAESERSLLADHLAEMYPHEDARVNWLLSELTAFLAVPESLPRTLSLLENATTQEEQIHYAGVLQHQKEGWLPHQRRTLLNWLVNARRFRGGKLVRQTVQNLTLETLSDLGEKEKQLFKMEMSLLEKPVEESPISASLPIVRRWNRTDFAELTEGDIAGRDRQSGMIALAKANCLRCHAFADRGGQIGPDLTRVGARFGVQALLESILEPSRVIDEKYRYTSYVLESGKVIAGRPTGVNARELTIEINPLTEETVRVSRDEIEESLASHVSPMPTGLVDVLTREEILDLIACLRVGPAVSVSDE